MNLKELEFLFGEINFKHFEGLLDLPEIVWNTRLRSSAGRFVPGSRQFLFAGTLIRKPRIEIAHYLIAEVNARDLIEDTLAHEMIHYWLWTRRRPYGHTAEFLKKMKAMGVSRYNSAPKLKPPKYEYFCGHCSKKFLTRKRLGNLACADCCKKNSNGKYDSRFKLQIAKSLR